MGLLYIKTEAGDTISVPKDTNAETIAILVKAPVVRFSEFVYTGNSSRGKNSGNYEDLEQFFKSSGLDLVDEAIQGTGPTDDVEFLIYNLEHGGGICQIEHRGKVLTYHAQGRRGESNSFGYTWRCEYRLISCRSRSAVAT